jgi:hypothetical protein
MVATPAASTASDGQPDLHVDQLNRAGALEERLKGLDGAVGAAVPIARLVLKVSCNQSHLAANFSHNCKKGLICFLMGPMVLLSLALFLLDSFRKDREIRVI